MYKYIMLILEWYVDKLSSLLKKGFYEKENFSNKYNLGNSTIGIKNKGYMIQICMDLLKLLKQRVVFREVKSYRNIEKGELSWTHIRLYSMRYVHLHYISI